MDEKEEFMYLMEKHPELREKVLQILARPSPPDEAQETPDPTQ